MSIQLPKVEMFTTVKQCQVLELLAIREEDE